MSGSKSPEELETVVSIFDVEELANIFEPKLDVDDCGRIGFKSDAEIVREVYKDFYRQAADKDLVIRENKELNPPESIGLTLGAGFAAALERKYEDFSKRRAKNAFDKSIDPGSVGTPSEARTGNVNHAAQTAIDNYEFLSDRGLWENETPDTSIISIESSISISDYDIYLENEQRKYTVNIIATDVANYDVDSFLQSHTEMDEEDQILDTVDAYNVKTNSAISDS